MLCTILRAVETDIVVIGAVQQELILPRPGTIDGEKLKVAFKNWLIQRDTRYLDAGNEHHERARIAALHGNVFHFVPGNDAANGISAGVQNSGWISYSDRFRKQSHFQLEIQLCRLRHGKFHSGPADGAEAFCLHMYAIVARLEKRNDVAAGSVRLRFPLDAGLFIVDNNLGAGNDRSRGIRDRPVNLSGQLSWCTTSRPRLGLPSTATTSALPVPEIDGSSILFLEGGHHLSTYKVPRDLFTGTPDLCFQRA